MVLSLRTTGEMRAEGRRKVRFLCFETCFASRSLAKVGLSSAILRVHSSAYSAIKKSTYAPYHLNHTRSYTY
jgi:hypothetical protein